MPRVKRGFKARRRRNKVLKLAKGYRGARSKLFRSATEAVDRALNYAFRDRRVKKRDFRSLWITRINAASRLNGLSYSKFCLLYTSDAADDLLCVDLGGRRIIKKKKNS